MIYIACFFASVSFAYLASRSSRRGDAVLFSVISILVMCVLGGLRKYTVGIDSYAYGPIICGSALTAPDLVSFVSNSHMETGYLTLTYVLMKTLGHQNWCISTAGRRPACSVMAA